MSESSSLAHRWVAAFLATFLTACSSNVCPQMENARAVVRVTYSTGGLAPLETHLYLFPDGLTKLVTPNGRRLCRTLTEEQLASLLGAVKSVEFRESLSGTASRQYDKVFADVEEIRIWMPGEEVTIPVERVPRPVGDVLRKIEEVFKSEFGASYELDLALGFR